MGFALAGNDIITVEPGAAVVMQFSNFEAIASANAIAIDAGGGNNQVTNENNGSIIESDNVYRR
jgi:hypothetical protein